jgi:hypothetical protein
MTEAEVTRHKPSVEHEVWPQRGDRQMTQAVRPYGSPGCWGQQFTDGDRECTQCAFREGCRSSCMYRATQTPMAAPVQNMVSLPARPYIGGQPVAPPVPQMFRPTAMAPAMQQQPIVQYQQYQQPVAVASLPDPYNPNPVIPMMRPGAPAPAYYFCQYPGETTIQRLGKNMALRASESVFGELMFFFRHWTWPPRSC